MSRHFALIPAAGSGSRLGNDRPKQYLLLDGRPMLDHALSVLCSHRLLAKVYVVLAPDDRWFRTFDWDALDGKLNPVFCGGATRAHSVRNALDRMAPEVAADDWVLVHDAARPCITGELITRLIDAVDNDPVGGLLALRVADTLKRGDESRRIVGTEAREALWQAQTPQMFRRELLQRALAAVDPGIPTDEARAVEQLGLKPLLVESSSENLKVTYACDVRLAEAILKSR
ncbi:MAG: 2-C-methyl-D-erythritol 4-phosphate cytidylyltransferase [Burkholderiales bacterium]